MGHRIRPRGVGPNMAEAARSARLSKRKLKVNRGLSNASFIKFFFQRSKGRPGKREGDSFGSLRPINRIRENLHANWQSAFSPFNFLLRIPRIRCAHCTYVQLGTNSANILSWVLRSSIVIVRLIFPVRVNCLEVRKEGYFISFGRRRRRRVNFACG